MKLTKGSPKYRAARALLFAMLAAFGLFCSASAQAADYYVATTGSDSNAGTMAAPFATLQKGADVAAAGDTVYIRGGTYKITTPKTSGAGLTFSKSGTSDTNRIKYWAYAGELPVFDFSNLAISTANYTHGFVVTGSWLHFRGLELHNVPMNTRSNNAIDVSGGSNCIFELLNLHHNAGTGIFVAKSGGGHLIVNCDSHDNYDPTSPQGDGQNADGFGVHYQTSGPSTTVRGCRAWWNSDDGYDLINQEVPVIIENSWAMGNGYINSGTARPGSGNGNGFKAGSSKTGVRHTIRGNLAWKNVASGFYANHSSGGNDWYNNTSYNNGTQYNMLASDPTDSSITIILTGTLVHKMRNNLGFPTKNANMTGVDTGFNTWDLAITPAAADFTSVTDTGAMGPRESDGSVPNLTFMKLPAGSKMIDKGTNVGLAFAGAAPDLGAFEYGAITSTGSGGAAGAGGSMAAGGAPGAGGSSAAGGTVTAGGSFATGGTPGAGGLSAAGGTSGGNSSGGAQASAGNPSGGGSTTSSGGSRNGASNDATGAAGCGCRFIGTSAPGPSSTLFPLLGALALLLKRSRRGRRAVA